MAAASGKSLRLALATQGTRGDFQPMLALACGLRKAGHEVFIVGNQDHLNQAKAFGFDGVVGAEEVKDLLNTDLGRKAMETGDLLACFGATGGDGVDYGPLAAEGLDKFRPQLILFSALIGALIGWYARERHIPALLVAYQPQGVPSNEFGPAAMFRLELEEGQPMLCKWANQAQFLGKANEDAIEAAMREGKSQEEIDMMPSAENTLFDAFMFEDHPAPVLLAYSEAFWSAPADWPKSGWVITGRWAISREEQESSAKSGGKMFDAGGELQRCVDFIGAGSTPVYLGWGSMTVGSDEHMARLAVGALKVAGQRGIIIAGWADLSADSLGSGPEAEELVAFCKASVLFMKAAPHEWLFPQCACCVHHGGIGTTQASLGSGTPTIVTPVFADQFDIADRVERLKWGAKTTHLSKLTAQELGEAIKRVCEDSSIKANTTALAAAMAKEDGIAFTTKFIERWLEDEVLTGKLEEKQKQYDAKIAEFRKKTKNMPFDRKMAVITGELNKRYQVLRDWNAKSLAQYTALIETATKGKLWYVKGSRCLARAGEKLKSDEVGRYREFAFLELLEEKGSRLHVKLLKGIGPREGWVSTEVKGVEIVAKVPNTNSIQLIIAESFKKLFSDIAS